MILGNSFTHHSQAFQVILPSPVQRLISLVWVQGRVLALVLKQVQA
jgi:hypothetical protein